MINLFEKINPFYSDQEAKIRATDKTTQSTPPEYVRHPNEVSLAAMGVENFNNFTYNSFTQNYLLPFKNQYIKQWRTMAYHAEVEKAIDEIINEAIVYTDNSTKSIEINLESLEISDNLKKKISAAYDKIYRLLNIRKNGHKYLKKFYVDSELNFETVYKDQKNYKDGIQTLILLDPLNFLKFRNPKDEKIRYFYSPDFFHQNQKSGQQSSWIPMDLYSAYTKRDRAVEYYPEQITQITTDVESEDKMFYLSFLHSAEKILNQLSLIEDSIVIYRLTRSPDKKAFYVDVGNLAAPKAEQVIKKIMNNYKSKMMYRPDSGDLINRPKQIAMQESYWLPVGKDGRGTKIETINGSGAELRDIADLDYFADRLYKALKVPVTRRSGDDRFTYQSSTEIVREELNFFKFIQKLRNLFNQLFLDLLKKELLSTNVFNLNDWLKIEDSIVFDYQNNTEYSDMKEMQLFTERAGIASQFLQMPDLVSNNWIQKNVLKFTDEDIKDDFKEKEKEKQQKFKDQLAQQRLEQQGQEPPPEQ